MKEGTPQTLTFRAMLFCAHLTIRVGHRPYLPPLLPQRPCWPRLPPATKPLPAGAAPGPVPPALPRASHTATARPPPALLRQLRARGGRLQGHVCSRRVPAGKRRHLPGAGRAGPGRPLLPPGLERGRGAGGSAPRSPEPAMAASERLGAVPVEVPGEGKGGEGSGHRPGAPGERRGSSGQRRAE